jgi:hypothetical protein
MKKSGIAVLLAASFVWAALSGCAGTPPANNNRAAEAAAASNAAVAAMTGGNPAPSPASGPVTASSGKTQPAWVASPGSVYNRNTFVSGVGSGNDRAAAEQKAFAALSSVFNQTLKADMNVIESYQESVKSGAVRNWTENTAIENAINTSTAMELVGAEIRDVWSDGKTFYAVAVMEKAQTTRLYTRMIQDNQRIIDTLMAAPAAGRNSLDGLARFQFAATLAELNKIFANVLSVIGAPVPGGIKAPEDFRLEAVAIMKNIPVSVTVQNDRDDRIRAAFISALSAAGFRTGGDNSRYQIQARLSLTEVKLPNQTNTFVRYLIDGNFTNTPTGAILFPDTINGREGHITLPEAEARALRSAENKIKDEYAEALSAFLSRLIPKK